MADEAFALSPISARAALPSEADYDAIRDAFMETSRGRWFLGEYAKRNRNADTAMVLDAVARIEETLSAQKKPARDPALDEALAAIRAALDAARIAASAALADLALDENMAPVRKGVRVIREISWRLREIGADGRICDLIDSQVGAIEEASKRLATIDPATALNAAFELIEGRIGAFDAHAASGPVQEPVERAVGPSPRSDEETYSRPGGIEQAVIEQATIEHVVIESVVIEQVVTEQALIEHETPAPPAQAVADDTPDVVGEAVQVASVAGKAGPETGILTASVDAAAPVQQVEATTDASGAMVEPVDAFNERDEAVLDMVAAEMAAPDSDEAYVPPGMKIGEGEAAELPEAEPAAMAEQAASTVMPVRPAPDADGPSPEPSPEPSLGSSLIANGIVQRPRAPRPDPLAAIRRMSQSERIAFFS